MLILHGGNPLEITPDIKSKENDCERLRREFQNVMQNHYKEGLDRIAFRLVECPHVFQDVLPALKDITPHTDLCGGGEFLEMCCFLIDYAWFHTQLVCFNGRFIAFRLAPLKYESNRIDHYIDILQKPAPLSLLKSSCGL